MTPFPVSQRGSFALPALAGAVLLGSLAACSVFEAPAPPPPCPRVAAVDDAARLTRYSGTGRDLTDVAFEAEIGQMIGSCAYDDDDEVIDVELQVQIIAARGPADEARRADFKYFIAVARLDRTVIAREEFETYIEFPGNQTRAGIVEDLAQHIPITPGERGDSYVIYVGFSLSADELEFNRAQQ